MKDGLVVVVKVVAKAGKEAQLGEAFKELVPMAQTEPGFIQYDLHASIEKPGHFVFYEIWKDEASLDLHSKTDFAKAFGARTGDWIESVSLEKYQKIS
jgi:quinol monooxygenase YgiN